MTVNCWHIPTSEKEIVEIYFEEVGELLDKIDDHLKTWGKHPGDKKTLTEIRRAFHTIKGSGRLANVLDLSELAWEIEKMLNQAIAGAVPVSEPMIKLVASVRTQIPKMIGALKQGHSIARNDEIARLMKLASILASERRSAQIAAQLSATTSARKPSSELYEINLKLDRCMRRADEALRRSEMALRQARHLSGLKDVPHAGLDQLNRAASNDHGSGWLELIASALFGAVIATIVFVTYSILG